MHVCKSDTTISFPASTGFRLELYSLCIQVVYSWFPLLSVSCSMVPVVHEFLRFRLNWKILDPSSPLNPSRVRLSVPDEDERRRTTGRRPRKPGLPTSSPEDRAQPGAVRCACDNQARLVGNGRRTTLLDSRDVDVRAVRGRPASRKDSGVRRVARARRGFESVLEQDVRAPSPPCELSGCPFD